MFLISKSFREGGGRDFGRGGSLKTGTWGGDWGSGRERGRRREGSFPDSGPFPFPGFGRVRVEIRVAEGVEGRRGKARAGRT